MKTYALIAHLGSLRTALALMLLLAAVVLAGTMTDRVHGTALTAALLLLGVSLLAAMVVHPAFRRQMPLLVFHLALLALVILVAWGRLASMGGRFELTEGVPYDGRLIDGERGPLYGGALERMSFRHDGFQIDYAPGLRRGATRNRVSWHDAQGRPQSATIGDHRPLVLDGHRFYTSPNKGFAPILRWQPDGGAPEVGSVHLPSFPMHELRQSREWNLPGGPHAWVMLQFDETLIDARAASSFRMPRDHRLILRVGDQRFELAPGDTARVDGGVVVYEGLRTWMGYRVTYDPSLPWLLASSLLAAFSLLWHYVARFAAQSRQASESPGWRREVQRG